MKNISPFSVLLPLSIVYLSFSLPSGIAAELELRQGDHICYIGNTLAERMQHEGWLETLIQARFPELNLSFRNLAFSADEIDTRPRSQNFGNPDSHLQHSSASVIFAFFGYNESFAGSEGVDHFQQQLANHVEHLRKQSYNGKVPARVVLFSPIACENLKNRHLPSGRENNGRLALYSKAIQEVAQSMETSYVDLFQLTYQLYLQETEPLTINGIHLNQRGNRLVAQSVARTLFGGDVPDLPNARLETLRQAVLDKNLHWFNRYRATDGFSVFGGRSGLKFVAGQTNYVVMQRELAMLDTMTANRDKRIWALAAGQDQAAEDNNLPDPVPVVSNKQGSGDDGQHVFLSGTEAIGKMETAKGMSIGLFASEEEFPELINPVQSAVDPDGRLWVATWPSYPHWNPKQELNDQLLILEDHDADGKCDQVKVFADKLHNPTGLEFWGGGVIVAQTPDLMFLKDTDGDDVADVRIRMMHGIDSADTHHTANSFTIGPSGWLYFQRGVFHFTNIESPWGKPVRDTRSAVYRFDPLTWKFEYHFSVGPNPHGDTFDDWGHQFVTDGTTGRGFYIGFPQKGAPKDLFQKVHRPVPAIAILSSQHFPDELQGNLLICNVIGFQGISQYKFVDAGSGFHAEQAETIVSSSDPNFRPSDLEIGGDGALYFLDWQNPLIGHMQHNLRDPSRDHLHGRVYRLTVDGRPPMEIAKMMGKPVIEVLEHLKSKTKSVRYRARLELSGRDSHEVTDEVVQWARQFDAQSANDAQPLVEALWIHQMHRIPNEILLRAVLSSPVPQARAAGVRALREWFDQIPAGGRFLLAAANDPHPRVRAEAVVAATYFDGPEAAQTIFAVESHSTDQQLDFNLNEARQQIKIDDFIKSAIASGEKLSPGAMAFALKNASVNDLLKLPPTERTFLAILARAEVSNGALDQSLQGLANLREISEVDLALDLVEEFDAKDHTDQLLAIGNWLAQRPPPDLVSNRGRLQKLATAANSNEARQVGYAVWVTADGSTQSVLPIATKTKEHLETFFSAIPLIANGKLRSDLFPILQKFITQLPAHLDPNHISQFRDPGLWVDFFSLPPTNATREAFTKLVSTEAGVVQQFNLNLPHLQGKNTSNGFALSFRGMIQIPRSGEWTFSTNSDDGSRLYIGDECVVDNDGDHGAVEKTGKIRLTAGNFPIALNFYQRGGNVNLNVTWQGPETPKQEIPPEVLSIASTTTLYDLAIESLTSIPGNQSQKFHLLATAIESDKAFTSAIRVLATIPEDHWPPDKFSSLAANLVMHVANIPPALRTRGAALDALALGDRLAAKLPTDHARQLRARLADLKVHVIDLGTVPHRMIYDKEILAVQAGKPVEFVFTNTDQMPHNFAVVSPGYLEEVGLLAEQTSRDKDAVGRHYIPSTDKVLVAGRLLQAGQRQAISYTAPDEEGIYPYVCTFPGHWRRMYGALYVVRDLKTFSENPEQYVAKHSLKILDPLLNELGRSREWKLKDLASRIEQLHGGRSFEVGKQLFTVSTCAACHKVDGKGSTIGPDLAQLDAKIQPLDILKSVLLPSDKIENKYQTYQFILVSGKTVTGMIVNETEKTYELLSNPLTPDKLVTILKEEIDERFQSSKSIMPDGLLSKLKEEEILDLIAFIISRGEKQHKLFQAHHAH